VIYGSHRILIGDVRDGLRSLEAGSARCCVTSPPYWGLRDYGVEGQIGLEATPEQFIARMVEVFREVRRVLADDATLFLNIGDSYAAGGNGVGSGKQLTNVGSWMPPKRAPDGLKPKDLVGIPWMLAFALRADGWYLRSDIVWHKPNPMPESVTDRPTKSHEYIFLLSKSQRYYYDAEAVKEGSVRAGDFNCAKDGDDERPYAINRRIEVGPTRNARSVWTIATQAYSEAHFATFPEALPERCIKAGSSEKGQCPACRKPWVRVVERAKPPVECYTSSRKPKDIQPCAGGGGMGGKLQAWYDANPPTTTGWRPTCECGRDPIPDVVLEPFAGSGTTLLVANRLGRDAVGCELNPEYAAMAERRIGAGLRPSTFRIAASDIAPLFQAQENP